VDLRAEMLTVNFQMGLGETTAPKGRTRRSIPMTGRLVQALKDLQEIPTGYVIRNRDGSPMTDNQIKNVCNRLCRWAGIPERGWHTARHSFGTHAAMFGVNPWTLMMWMGHKRIDETMLYVNLGNIHRRQAADAILAAGEGERDPDMRVIKMLGARGDPAVRQQVLKDAQAM